MNFPPENDPSKAASWPLFDKVGWADYWEIADWMTWHAVMEKEYGLTAANRRFIQAWNQDAVWHSAPLDARSFNSTFRAYARQKGFFDDLFSGLASLAKPLGLFTDASDAISEVGEGVKTSGSLLKWLVPVAAVVLFFLYARLGARPALSRK
jgi:hypothetical protein